MKLHRTSKSLLPAALMALLLASVVYGFDAGGVDGGLAGARASGGPADRAVVLSYFAATSTDEGIEVAWRTAVETANAGFNLYAETDEGSMQLNEELILSQAVDSTAPLDYGFSAEGTGGDAYILEAVGVDGGSQKYGPFPAGEVLGTEAAPEMIDWAAIRAEQQAASATHAAPEATQGSSGTGALRKGGLGGQLAYPEFALGVQEDGIYRVTYEELEKATGIGLRGVPARSLALTSQGEAAPLRILGGRVMGPGVALEFLGKALDTLYTEENVYILRVDRAKYSKMPTFTGQAPAGATAPTYYVETAAFEADNEYSIRSTSGDPWYDTLLHAAKPQNWSFSMETDNLVSGPPATLNLELWGGSRGEHHVVARVNGAQAADIRFSGRGTESVSAPLNSLKAGANALELTLPNDLGATTDTVILEGYGLTYPRAFAARAGRLSFDGDAQVFTVSGLPSPDVVVYMEKASGPQRISAVQTKAAGGAYEATFPGNGAGKYYVSSAGVALKPAISLAATADDILSGTADLLIISHPSFIAGLAPLVTSREAQGYGVKVVDVNGVYRAYSGGIFDAAAVRSYVKDAIEQMGVQYVLLVGADTTNYRNYGGSLSKSFLPTLYVQTDREVHFTPADPLFTDVDGDEAPDAAIGRFPVRTAGELRMMVDKTLLYDRKAYNRTAVFAADNGFGHQSAVFVAGLSGDWSVDEAYLDDSDVNTARQTLIGALNEGVALASYVGHSALYNWASEALFTSVDAKALVNYDKPTILTQFGCWNAYYVDPEFNSLGHRFLLSGTNGAALVTGATTLTWGSSEYELGRRLMPMLSTPGRTVGAAVQEAKADLAQTYPGMIDVLLGWTILGDPTAVVQP